MIAHLLRPLAAHIVIRDRRHVASARARQSLTEYKRSSARRDRLAAGKQHHSVIGKSDVPAITL